MGLEFKIAKTPEEKNLAYNVRYKVFCEELGYLDKTLFPDKLEKDEYDDLETTINFIAFENNEGIATARIIKENRDMAIKKNSRYGLPIEDLFEIMGYDEIKSIPAEISRSSIIQEKRKSTLMLKLWREVFRYSRYNNMIDLLSCVGTETDDLLDAQIIFYLAKKKGLFHRNVTAKIKTKYPLYAKTKIKIHEPLNLDEINLLDFPIPETLQVYEKLGIQYIGEPTYYKKFWMCTLPIILPLDMLNEPFNNFIFGQKRSNKV